MSCSRPVAASDVGRLRAKLASQLTKAKAKKEQAEAQCASGDTKRARNAPKKSVRKLIGFSHTVRSLTGRRNITDATLRNALDQTAAGIATDMKTLRSGLACP